MKKTNHLFEHHLTTMKLFLKLMRVQSMMNLVPIFSANTLRIQDLEFIQMKPVEKLVNHLQLTTY